MASTVKEEFDHERFLVALTNYGTAMCALKTQRVTPTNAYSLAKRSVVSS